MSTPETPRFLPKDAERCVWMAAGMVAYKLCDRAFECESCPFDAVMRGQASAHRAALEPALAAVSRPDEFPDDRSYHAAHTWAQAVCPGRLRIGIDSFAAWLIGEATSVVLPAPATMVAAGRAGTWLIDDGGPIPVRMPVSGTVLRSNPLLRTYPRLAVEAPYTTGWLIEVRPAKEAEALAGLLTAAEMELLAAARAREFEAQAHAHAERGENLVGATMADGGERIADLKRMLGAKLYRQMIERLLGE